MNDFSILNVIFKILVTLTMNKKLSRKQKDRVSTGVFVFLTLWGVSLVVHEATPTINKYLDSRLGNYEASTK